MGLNGEITYDWIEEADFAYLAQFFHKKKKEWKEKKLCPDKNCWALC